MLRYFDQCIIFRVHRISTINVCANFEINRFKIYEFRKHTKIVFYLTCRNVEVHCHK